MTIAIKHAFTSLKGDGTDATQVQPSYWNAVHAFTMASGVLVGRLTAGAGNAEEIAISAFMASIMNTADAASLATLLGCFETGDVKFTFKSSASAGWLMMLGGTGTPPNTIGNAASGATLRANADVLNLYTVVYNTVSDANAPVSGGRSGNAVNDFNANKTLLLPNMVGRSPIGAGAASNAAPSSSAATAARIVGYGYGEENHLLLTAEMPSHYHTAAIYDPQHSHSSGAFFDGGGGGGGVGGGGAFGRSLNSSTNAAATGVRVNSSNGIDTTNSTGGGGGHNIIHSSLALNVMVKL